MREAGFTRVANRDTRPTVIRVCPASNVLTQQLGNAVGLFGRMFMLKSLDTEDLYPIISAHVASADDQQPFLRMAAECHDFTLAFLITHRASRHVKQHEVT